MKKLIYLHKALSVYYKWILEQKNLEIHQQLLELAQNRLHMIDKKYRAGAADKLKVIDVQRQINKRQSEVIKSQVELSKYAAQLSLFIRNEQGEPIHPIPEKSTEQILLSEQTAKWQHSQPNPQLKILAFEQEYNKLEYDLNDQKKLPGLSVDVSGGRELSSRPPYGQHILQVGVQFDYPLENRKAHGKSVAYHYKRKAVEKELLYAKQELKQQFQFSTQASAQSRSRYEVTNQEFENSKKVAEGERKKWALGASDLFVVNLREQDQADVDMRRWAALYDFHQYNLDAALYSASLPIE